MLPDGSKEPQEQEETRSSAPWLLPTRLPCLPARREGNGGGGRRRRAGAAAPGGAAQL